MAGNGRRRGGLRPAVRDSGRTRAGCGHRARSSTWSCPSPRSNGILPFNRAAQADQGAWRSGRASVGRARALPPALTPPPTPEAGLGLLCRQGLACRAPQVCHGELSPGAARRDPRDALRPRPCQARLRRRQEEPQHDAQPAGAQAWPPLVRIFGVLGLLWCHCGPDQHRRLALSTAKDSHLHATWMPCMLGHLVCRGGALGH